MAGNAYAQHPCRTKRIKNPARKIARVLNLNRGLNREGGELFRRLLRQKIADQIIDIIQVRGMTAQQTADCPT